MIKDNQLDTLVGELVTAGFENIASMRLSDKKKWMQSGWAMVVNNPIMASTVHDCSLLHFTPRLLLRPVNLDQLKLIVLSCVKKKIPISFASGKTGLSGGFTSPFVVVDMESLHTIPKPYFMNMNEKFIEVDQNVLVAELIRRVQQDTHTKFIFPAQPSSSFKLPVMIGGLIATNASGVIAGKLGPIKEWIISIEILTPQGEQKTILAQDPDIGKYIGGEGRFGIILNAKIRIAPNESTNDARLLFGDDLETAFTGLQSVQDEKIFPLSSEFILSESTLPGKFGALFKDRPVKWAILLRGNKNELEQFESYVAKHTKLQSVHLSNEEYQAYLEERTALATQTRSQNSDDSFILYPGFEDVLMQPQFAFKIFNEVNEILTRNYFPQVMVGYGHINFRQGLGILMHLRVPVSINQLIEDRQTMFHRIAKTVAEMNVNFIEKYDIIPKAEHAIGMIFPWRNRNDIANILNQINKKEMFPSPHVKIFQQVCERLQIPLDRPFTTKESINSLTEYYYCYLMGKLDIIYGE
ncbi:FAD-binding oxidoreductase [Candidatus Lokiarchaeum ossiferum]|uniref:FAD-binding oxidoreductase n=1 Tax=Candidatus Lokiarchaeum ossiferum TaxID=2951803 RepID=UPI00352E084A